MTPDPLPPPPPDPSPVPPPDPSVDTPPDPPVDAATPAALYFGGSFNPPHRAHTACAAAAAAAAGLGAVVLVPTGRPALKDPADVAPAADRLAMTRLAAAAAGPVPFFVDDLELRRPGVTYTVDTVEALVARGVSPVNWLIGADQLLNLHRWHRFEDLLRLARFRVMARPGYAIDWAAVHPAARGLSADAVTVPQLDVSATGIRRRLRAGAAVDDLVVPAVRDYLLARGLYGAGKGGEFGCPATGRVSDQGGI